MILSVRIIILLVSSIILLVSIIIRLVSGIILLRQDRNLQHGGVEDGALLGNESSQRIATPLQWGRDLLHLNSSYCKGVTTLLRPGAWWRGGWRAARGCVLPARRSRTGMLTRNVAICTNRMF